MERAGPGTFVYFRAFSKTILLTESGGYPSLMRSESLVFRSIFYGIYFLLLMDGWMDGLFNYSLVERVLHLLLAVIEMAILAYLRYGIEVF